MKNFFGKVSWRIKHYKKKISKNLKKDLSENRKVLNWAAKSPRRSSFFYYFFSSKFDREHHSVLNGKLAHYGSEKSSSAHDSTLRRNIHRLEKGLISMPLRKIFALEYLEETIKSYEEVIKFRGDKETIKWADDVLMEYFNTVELSENVKKAKLKFQAIRKIEVENLDANFKKAIPYYRKDNIKSDIDFEQFFKLSKQRRSVRWYQNKKIPQELINKALSAATLAPSACNRQPYRFIFIDDPEELKIAGFLPMGAKAFAHNIPMMAILVGDLTAYFDERDRHIIYIDGGLAAMSFMYALETLGLSSCPINWPDIEEREKSLDQFLNLPNHERCVMFISIGYPLEEGKIPFSQKKSLKIFLSPKKNNV